jgi:hypothetical protein
MNKEIKQCFLLLRDYRNSLTKQQKKTFKGQILSGDYQGFKLGLFNLMKVKYVGGR